jgi:predicted ArsR family transcriptional regulator
LEILKRRGEITVQELSQELDLTSVTVRHHLEILRSEGYITDPEVRRSNRPGRPRYVYRLTSMAADLFPNNYSGLADALLRALNENVDEEQREALLEKTAHKLSEGAEDLPEDREARLDGIVSYLKKLGFVSRWEETEAGEYNLYVCNCPYHYVAESHPEVCQIDRIMLGELTGARLERFQGHASNNALCGYQLHWDRDEG